MTTGERIKAARKARSMKQAALAEKLGLKESNISQWERGIRNPKFSSLCKIAEALNVSVSELTEVSQHDYALEQNIEALRKERDELHRIIDQTTVRLNDETARVFALQRRCDDLEKSRQAWVMKCEALIGRAEELKQSNEALQDVSREYLQHYFDLRDHP